MRLPSGIGHLAAASLFLLSGATVAAPVADQPVIYDRAIDPLTASIRAALRTAPGDGVFRSKADAAAIAAWYAARGHVPAWTSGGKLAGNALAIMERIGAADEDGLDANAYSLPRASLGRSAPASLADLAVADLMVSQAIVAYARAASTGRVDPKTISENFGYKITAPDAAAVLSGIVVAADPVASLAAYNPPQPEYVALRAKLAELRAAGKARPREAIPDGPLLKPGMSDPRVPALRERFAIAAPAVFPDLYDETVVAAVEAFQRSAGLSADGMIGAKTVAALNRGEVDREAVILANMERWRWMPRDMGAMYVRVNIPNYNVEIHRNGAVVHETRVVVGTVTNQTPIFSDQIEFVVVNPVWNVPASIAVKEMLPALKSGRRGLRGYQVYANIRGRFRAVDPRMINWRTVDMRKIQIKQPPGERNALGSIKFMFPNEYAVYLHDTPSKSLFERETRAFSHGCVRVMDPWAFADALLSVEADVSTAKLKRLVGGPERRVDLSGHVPVHLTYFTAWVDATGVLQVRDDVYGHDKRLEAALGAAG
jgi:L,D-transpeptidase YcbB